jgi:AAA ATPase domain
VDDQLLIGREREQAQLWAWAADALAGRGSLVLLAGEAGVGKTTLARRALAGSGLEVLEGVGVQGGTSAFGPVVEVLRAHLRIEGGGPLVEGPLAAHLALLLPELGPPAAEGDRATLFEAIRLALAAIAARRPAALLLDDLQWADDATLELLAALARSLDTQPLLILGAFRSDERPGTTPSGACAASCAGPAGCGRSPSSPWRPRPPPPCWSGPWGRPGRRCAGPCSTGPTASPSSSTSSARPWPPAAGSRPAPTGWSCWRARTSRSPTASATPCCCGRPACPTTPGSPS